MKFALAGLAAALSLLAPSVAAADAATAAQPSASPRFVELRVMGDEATVARVRLTARELLLRLDVEPRVKALDEAAAQTDEAAPLVIAYIDLRDLASPSIDIEDGRTHQALMQRRLSEVTSLETGVEGLLHVLYLAVEATLQLTPAAPPVTPKAAPSEKPKHRPPPPSTARPAPVSIDAGPLLRLSSLGGTRFVPGGGLSVEPRLNWARSQLGLQLAASFHASTEVAAARGAIAEVRPVQLRLLSTFDWLLSPEASVCVGAGGGADSLLFSPIEPPDAGSAAPAQSLLDPVLSGVMGARVHVSGRAFLTALASIDLDLAPTKFMVRDREQLQPVLSLPRLRGGVTLALGFTAAGARRFSKAEVEP